MACKHCNGPTMHRNPCNPDCRVKRASDDALARGYRRVPQGYSQTIKRAGIQMIYVLSSVTPGGPGRKAKEHHSTWAPAWAVAIACTTAVPVPTRIALLQCAKVDAELRAAAESVDIAGESAAIVLAGVVQVTS